MIVPTALVDSATALKESLGGAPPPLEQVTLTRFIEDGSYSRHLRRVGKVMTERRAALIESLRGCFETASLEEWTAEDHVAWSFPGHFAAAETVRNHARAGGIALDIVEHGGFGGEMDGTRTLSLSYARMNEHQIAAGVAKLASVIEGIRNTRAASGAGT
jgi:GntR family transcriptional regulator / MocR family aminotransferase